MLVGRAVTDVVGIVTGVEAIIYGGGLMASGGVACGLTMGVACVIVPEALVAGAALAAVGVTTAAASVTGAVDTGVALVESISGSSSSSSSNIEFKYDEAQLQHLFDRHKNDFGWTGNWNKKKAKEVYDDLISFINEPDVKKIQETYRSFSGGAHYYQERTGLWVFVDKNNNIVSGWKLYPSQVKSLLQSGYVK